MSILPLEQALREKTSRVMRAVRKNAGLTQTDIAERLQTSQSAISKIEAGTLAPPLMIWMAFCKEMGIDPAISCETGLVDFSTTAAQSIAPNSAQKDDPKFKIPARYLSNPGTTSRWILPLLILYHSRHGTERLTAFLKTKMQIDPDFFVILNFSVNFQFMNDLLRHMSQSGDLTPQDTPAIAQIAAIPDIQGSLSPGLNNAENSRKKLLHLITHIEKYETNFIYRVEQEAPSGLHISVTAAEQLKHFDFLNRNGSKMGCVYRQNFLQAVGRCSNENPLKLTEHQCLYDGADRCIYEIEIA